jgi:putative hydrolase of the HAD superfamily
MIKAILFDLDNTLIDFLRMKRIACEAAVEAMIDAGLDVKKKTALKDIYAIYDRFGMEDPKVFQKMLKKVTGKVDYRILANAIVAYRRARTGFLVSYPHVKYTLLKLKSKGLKLAIVTDAPRLKAWIRLANMNIADMFDAVIAFEDSKVHKPSKKPFLAALKKLRVNPEECLMVGDWPERDMKGAKQLGIKTVFAKYGNRKVRKSGADFEIADIKELLDIV